MIRADPGDFPLLEISRTVDGLRTQSAIGLGRMESASLVV